MIVLIIILMSTAYYCKSATEFSFLVVFLQKHTLFYFQYAHVDLIDVDTI